MELTKQTLTYSTAATAKQTQSNQLTVCSKTILRMLTMNSMELCEYLLKESYNNPCLECSISDSSADFHEFSNIPFKDPDAFRYDLISQLPMALDKEVLSFARQIIFELDRDGFFSIPSFDHIDAKHRDPFQKALTVVQSLEPPGIGARSLRECFQLQAKRIGLYQGPLRTILQSKEAFALCINRQVPELCSRFGFTKKEIGIVFSYLSSFRTHPIDPDEADIAYVIPDAEIIEKEEGTFSVHLLERSLPNLQINASYVHCLDRDGSSFASKGLFFANRTIYCFHQRNDTLLSILTYTIGQQTGFLQGGMRKRLTQRNIASHMGMNPSTISRAIQNKYVLFRNEVFPVSSFFTSAGIRDASKEEILSFIRKESGNNISDRQLSELIRERLGISLSRRTVNKYRNSFNL